jgi:hypothetical protein
MAYTASNFTIGTTSNEYIAMRVVWECEGDIAANESTVVVKLQYKRTNTGYFTYGIGTFSLTVNGQNLSAKKEVEIRENDWLTVLTNTLYLSHDENGELTLSISASGSVPGTTLTSSSVETSVKLYTFPRASTIDSLSCATKYFNGEMTYKYTPKSANFYNRCNISLNLDGTYTAVKTINLGKQTTSQKTATVTLSEDELAIIYKKLPSSTQGKLRFTFRTYSDSGYSSQIGDAGYKEITLTIPNDTTTQPTVTMTLSPVSDFTSSSAIYVKGMSKVKASFTSGAGKYGASITSYKLTVGGKNYASPYTSDYLITAGSVTVKGTVTDSRGYSRAYSKTITVIDYAKPSLDSVTSALFFNLPIIFKYTPANTVFYSRCTVALNVGGTYTQIRDRKLGVASAGQKMGSATLSDSELSTIYNKLPNTTKGTLRFTFRTYIDSGYSEEIGESDYKEVTLSIPSMDDTQPTATMTLSPVSSLASPFNSLYIKGKTKVDANFTNVEGKYGASVDSCSMSVEGKVYYSPYTSGYIATDGAVTVRGLLIDSRGYSRTYTEELTFIPYASPKIIPASGESEIICARCDENGDLNDSGTYLKIKAKRSYSKVIASGVQKNFCPIRYRYKAEGGSYSDWTTILANTAASDEVDTGALLEGNLLPTNSYMVQVGVIDDVGESYTLTLRVSTSKIYMHRAGSMNSLGIGKYAEEENVVDIAQDITTKFRGDVQFMGEAWVSRELGTNVSESTVPSGRWGGSGVYYRVCAGGKHVYVAFNISFTTSSSTVRAESQTIPNAPNYDVYALCPVGFSDGTRGIATVSVSPKGRVNIYAVHKLPGATLSTGETVSWIDGYIDYWT